MDLNATLLFECLFFLSFVGLTRVYVWPPIEAILEQRRTDIQISLERARAAEAELERAHLEAEEIIKQARSKGDVKIKRASDHAVKIENDARDNAEKITSDLMAAASVDIEKEKIAVRGELKQEVVKTALLLLKKVLDEQPGSTETVLVNALTRDGDNDS